jgi:hypothetical protein
MAELSWRKLLLARASVLMKVFCEDLARQITVASVPAGTIRGHHNTPPHATQHSNGPCGLATQDERL